ncbi:hypothetical protein FNV43_RR26466 [Rhamnella rubrinervis]|uniref:Pentatricopeptide repeat-containing protein n=1 Tax=Rhamnella rubrinervis TaxID=2594499 RepID=A0A8K0DN11_9ROSA|nr:hypothetical protein FNV43_RR26466 [Rhamnella rubrinervis]
MPERNVVTYNAMLSGYVQSGRLPEAWQLFEQMPERNVVSWTSMLCGLANVGRIDEAWRLFNAMPEKNIISWNSMIAGLIKMGMWREQGVSCLGKQLHTQLIVNGWHYDDYDGRLSKSLIHMYSTFGMPAVSEHARQRCSCMDNNDFRACPKRTFAEAVNLFSEMWTQGVLPLNSTYSTLLGASGAMAYLDPGKQFHCLLIKTYYEFDLILENSLISMYSKCGEINDAYRIFTNMVSGSGMLKSGSLLILPSWESKGSRRTHLEPTFRTRTRCLGALLGVCGFSESNAKIARHAAKQVLKLDPLNAPAHVVLCNIYAANSQHAEERILRREMGLKGVRKVPGCSWIRLKGEVHVFLSGDKLKPEVDEMLLLLFQYSW